MIPEGPIRTPAELAAALQALRAAVGAGALVQILDPDAPFLTNTPVAQVPDAGPWGDYLELRFREVATGATLTLSVDTYHGAGGGLVRTP